MPSLRAFSTPAFAPHGDILSARLPHGYSLLGLVHEGKESQVWRATDEAGKLIAVKIARNGSPESVARFEAEARALAVMTHRSIVRMHAHGKTSDQRPFLALEWLEGPTLSSLLDARAAGLPPNDAIRLLHPIAMALLLAHDRGVIHGDVRAEHVILTPLDGDMILPMIVDFGGSLRTHPSIPPPPSNAPTPQIRDYPTEGNPAVDVRAFAALVFHAVAGRLPFAAPIAATSATVDVPRTGLSERDAALWRILAEGLAPVSTPRFKSLHDFARDLAHWADLRGVDSDVTGGPISKRWQGSKPPPSKA